MHCRAIKWKLPCCTQIRPPPFPPGYCLIPLRNRCFLLEVMYHNNLPCKCLSTALVKIDIQLPLASIKACGIYKHTIAFYMCNMGIMVYKQCLCNSVWLLRWAVLKGDVTKVPMVRLRLGRKVYRVLSAIVKQLDTCT